MRSVNITDNWLRFNNMKLFVLTTFIAVCTTSAYRIHSPSIIQRDCNVPDIKKSYQDAMYQFVVPFYKSIALKSNGHFVSSLNSAWIILAAFAEGCSKEERQQLFNILRLPNDPCIREKFYQIATTRPMLIKDGGMESSRNLLVDEGLTINPLWSEFVSRNSMLNIINAPLKNNPATQIREGPGFNFTGNSVMLDSNSYSVLWTTPFAGAVIERSPFYSQEGEEIGSVDLMRVKRKARMGYIKSVNAKVLALPVDANGLYEMFLVILLEKRDIGAVITEINHSIINEMIDSLKESSQPFDIAVPRIELSDQIDLRAVLETHGARSIWSDPEVTKFISTPPAFPTSYVQRSSIRVNEKGFATPRLQQWPTPKCSLGLDPRVGTDFIGNQPILMGLFDTETYTPLFGIGFTKPTYPKP